MGGLARATHKVRSYLDAWPLDYEEPAANKFLVPFQSTAIWIGSFEVGDDASILFSATLVHDIPVSGGLYRQVATNQPAIGSLEVQIDDDGEASLLLAYSMLADYLDEPEFRHAMTLFALVANGLDDEYVQAFGGRPTYDG